MELIETINFKNKQASKGLYFFFSVVNILILAGYPWLGSYFNYMASITYRTSWGYFLIGSYIFTAATLALSLGFQHFVSPKLRMMMESIRTVLVLGVPIFMGIFLKDYVFLFCSTIFLVNWFFVLTDYLRFRASSSQSLE